MTKSLLLVALSLSAAFAAVAGEGRWLTDYSKALEQAKLENKPMLLDFTGSDWCGWCMKMKEETLDKTAFKHYAMKNLILVEVDFPKAKSQSSALKEQNARLAEKFNCKSYPNFALIDKDEKVLGVHRGYLKGGPKAFIELLNTFYTPAAESAAPTTQGSNFDSFFKKSK